MPLKEKQLKHWLAEHTLMPVENYQWIAGGASARRFYRFQQQGESYILMDMSSDLSGCERYVTIAQSLEKLALCVPKVKWVDLEKGIVCMTDLGSQSYFERLNPQNVDQLYGKAMDALLILQASNLELPMFDEAAMMIGLHGFEECFLDQYLRLNLESQQKNMLSELFKLLIDNALQQPSHPMHRDYHSQNLLWQPSGDVGIVDFQDAKLGPVTYDLVSILRDCYIDWPVESVERWRGYFYQQLLCKGLIENCTEKQFIRWFDLMGLKRHLKALFTFSRKSVRDKDDSYLQYVPRTLTYVYATCEMYPELERFLTFLKAKVFA